MVSRRGTFLGVLCHRWPYIELFYVEQKVKIIINNSWNIPFHFQRTKKCQPIFVKKPEISL